MPRASITRWSMPSKRPHSSRTPGPAASDARAPGQRRPARRQVDRRAAPPAPRRARASTTSGRITMPGPPPNGASSTVRCLSCAKSRMSTVSSATPPRERLAGERMRRAGPGTSPGRASARSRSRPWLSPHAASSRRHLRHRRRRATSSRDGRLEQAVGGTITTRPPAMSTTGTPARVNGHQHALARLSLDLEAGAGAEIVHRADRAEARAVLQRRRETDEVGVVELVLLGRRQIGRART